MGQFEEVYSPADGEVYRRKTAGSGATDPADDATNYVAVSYDRTSALSAANLITSVGSAMTTVGTGSTKTNLAAIGVGARTSVLSVTGRGCIDYLAFAKFATGTTRVEVFVDGRSVLDQTDTYSTTNALLVLGMLSAGSSATNLIEARFDPAGVQFRRSLEVFITNTATASTTAAGIAYHLRSVA